MRASWVGGLLCLMVPLGLLPGCGDAQQAAPQSSSTGVVVDTKDLPDLGPGIGPLDEGRIEVAPPQGWYVPSRSSKFVIRFQADQASTYPTIIVTAEDFEQVLEVSEKNVGDFVKALKKAGAAKQVAPIKIGSFAGATYRRKGKAKYDFKTITVDRLFVDTVIDGRKYSVELRTRTGSAEQYAPYLYAVATGIKLLEAPGQEGPGETPKPKPEEKPEAKPEKKPNKEPEAEFEVLPEE